MDDNFFEIGGTSLKAVQMIALIKKNLDINLSIVKLFECPTISLLSKNLNPDNSGNLSETSDEIANKLADRLLEEKVI